MIVRRIYSSQVIVRGISQTNSEAALAGYLEYAPDGSPFSAVKTARTRRIEAAVQDVAQVEKTGQRCGAARARGGMVLALPAVIRCMNPAAST